MNRTLVFYLFFVGASMTAEAASNPPAAIREIRVTPDGDKVTVEIDLTDSVTPTLTFARHPDRLIADFPNVSPKQPLQHIPVGRNGVQRVRIGLNHSSPPITRVVVDLDSLRPFAVQASGRTVRLNIFPASIMKESSEEAGSSKAPQADTSNIVRLSPSTASFAPGVEPAAQAHAP